MIPVLKVGKVFVTLKGEKITILAVTKNGWFIGEDEHGNIDQWLGDGTPKHMRQHWIISEYKEPRVHERDVIWFKNGTDSIYVDTFIHGHTFGDHIKILKRETVKYVED